MRPVPAAGFAATTLRLNAAAGGIAARRDEAMPKLSRVGATAAKPETRALANVVRFTAMADAATGREPMKAPAGTAVTALAILRLA